MPDQLDLFTEADKKELADLREFFHNVKFCIDQELDNDQIENVLYEVLVKHPHLAVDEDPPYGLIPAGDGA